MLASAITAYLHYLGFMLSFTALSVELFHFKSEMTINEAKKVAFADIVYGLSATAVLATGILRVMYFGKGTEYYLNNPFFYIKIAIFIIVGLFSLYPTITFIFWFRDFQQEQTPTVELSKFKLISWLIKGELLGFVFIPLFAAIIARMS